MLCLSWPRARVLPSGQEGGRERRAGGGAQSATTNNDKEQAAQSSGGCPEAWAGGLGLCEGQKLQLCDKVHAPRALCLLENMSEKPWPYEAVNYNI